MALGDREASATLAAERSHASDLFPAVERLRDELGIAGRPVTLAAVYVGIGPGSYTGLRVGIACAQGLARATGAALVGVPSFEAIAFEALRPGESGAIACDARAGSFYFAAYEREENDVRERIAPCTLPYGRLAERLSAELTLLADERAREESASGGHAGRVRPLRAAHARTLLHLGPRRAPHGAAPAIETVEPLYLRAFGG